MGNAVILKPDVQTPIIGGVIFARLLEEAGLPNGLFHVLPGGADTGAALVKEPLINMISFTGSTRVCRQVGTIAGGQLKRVSLELGGNSPYIVLDDADIEAAASAGAWGAFVVIGATGPKISSSKAAIPGVTPVIYMGHGIEWKVSLIHSALARRGETRRWSRLRSTGVIGSANVDNVRKWQCAPKTRITCGGRSHPENCRLIW
jgi:hypothetical protein